MSYRSKRAMAFMPKGDVQQETKKRQYAEGANDKSSIPCARKSARVKLHSVEQPEIGQRSSNKNVPHKKFQDKQTFRPITSSKVSDPTIPVTTTDNSFPTIDERGQVLEVPKFDPIWRNCHALPVKQNLSAGIMSWPSKSSKSGSHALPLEGNARPLHHEVYAPYVGGERPVAHQGNARSTLSARLVAPRDDAHVSSSVMPSSTLPISSEGPQKNNMKSTSFMHMSSERPETDNLKPKLSSKKSGSGFDKINEAPVSPLRTKNDCFGLGDGQTGSGLESFKARRCTLIPDWPDDVAFDENEEVIAIDTEGKYQKLDASIQPHDVWFSNGVKYFVTFNEFYQPLRRGGHILVRFIGDVAKHERFCPIRITNWRNVNAQYKADIIKIIRGHFVIPDGDCYDQGILKRAGKSARQYRHYLKAAYFKPETKTRAQIYEAGPTGHTRDSWINLVDYWFSEKAKKFAECGRVARASQNHVHTTGSTSYANIRANFEDSKKREPSQLEIFDQTHRRKDGTFVEDTFTEYVLSDAVANIHTEVVSNPSITKSRVQLENEAFNKLMYGGEVPQRPLGYGFGVKTSDIFGVRDILRKERFISGENSSLALQNMERVVNNLTKENKTLTEQQEELKINNNVNVQLLKTMSTQLGQILDAVSLGNAPIEYLDLAKTVLNMATQQMGPKIGSNQQEYVMNQSKRNDDRFAEE